MLYFENAVRQELQTRGLGEIEGQAIVIFEQFQQLLERLYIVLTSPVLSIVCYLSNQEAFIVRETELTPFKLTLTDDDLAVLNQLLTKQRTQIGTAAGYPIYFDLKKPNKLNIEMVRRVMGDPLQPNAALLSEYQRAFVALESWGTVTEVITNSTTGDITLFFETGQERRIETNDSLFPALRAIFSRERIEVGGIVSDQLYYSPHIGFYNGDTCKTLTASELAVAKIDRAAFAVLSAYLAEQRIPNENTPKAQLIIESLRSGRPVVMGNCVGRTKVFFSLDTGLLIQSERAVPIAVHAEIRGRVHNAKLLKVLAPLTELYAVKRPRQVICVQPGEAPQVIPEKSKYFLILEKLVSGKIGWVSTTVQNGESRTYLIRYQKGKGILYSIASALELAEIQSATHFSLAALNISPYKEEAEENPEEATTRVERRSTYRERRRKEQKKLPQGRRR